MEPYYPAGYTQEEVAKIFGIKKNEPWIPTMPQARPSPTAPLDSFARE